MTPLPELPLSDTTAEQITGVLARQSELNTRIGQALQAFALTADRYDDELALIREDLKGIRARLSGMDARLDELERPRSLHSVKVDG